MKKSLLAGASGVLALGLSGGVAGCSGGGEPPFPATWTEIMEGESSVELRPDGTGTFEDVPLWAGTGECTLDGTSLYSGEVRWKHGPGGAIVVPGPNGDLSIYPDTEGFGGHQNWRKLSVAICGEETPSDEVVEYHGPWDF